MKSTLLPQLSFSILLALSLKQRHGYEIVQQVAEDSGGRIKLGPGALYGTLKKLSDDTLVEEIPIVNYGDRRKYYRLTKKGWDRLEAEMGYYRSIPRLAAERHITLGEADHPKA